MQSSQVTGEGHPEGRGTRRPGGSRQYRVFVLHHTHWDREWGTTFQASRIRLVELIDALLDALDGDPAFRNFLLDCQMIVLRDYLEIRPENREKLVRYLREGRIQCGPWYVLADEFLVSGEAHIRNLWLGRRTARDLDCPILGIGYIPDAFGHIAQMPQILRGFGVDNAFLWRGHGGEPETIKQEFLWEAPDGSEVLTHWFPDGYYWMPFLHFDNPDRPHADKVGRVRGSIERWGPRATTDVLLMPYGGDYGSIDRRLAAKIAEANAEIRGLGEIRWATAEEYIAAVREQNPSLHTVSGELRAAGPEHPHLLAGVLSSRLYLKRMNFRGQTWLERYAEPLSALAWLHGRAYDAGLLWKAWEYLVQNHPHDSICGTSVDQVHREMIARFDQSLQIAEIVAERCAQYVGGLIDTSDLSPEERALVVHNPLAWERTGWATVWLERADIGPRTHRLLDADAMEVPFQVRDVEGQRPGMERWRHTEIGFVAQGVPGLGYRMFRLSRRDQPLDVKQLHFTALQPTARHKGSEPVTDLAVGRSALENRHLRVEVDGQDGTLTMIDKRSREVYRGLNCFEDGGDAGDAYNYSPPLNDLVLRSRDRARVHISVFEVGYARATLRVDLDWALPEGVTPDRLSRSSSYVPARISTFVSLAADSRCVEITTEWENRSRDHRLRALFPLGVGAARSVPAFSTQGQFCVERRPTAMEDEGRGWPEPPVPAVPQLGWVSVDDGERGLTVANRGLPEVEILRDGQGTVALTLLRAFGFLSRDDLLARSGGAGPDAPTPDAQCLGPNRVSYAIIPHAGDPTFGSKVGWLSSRSYLTAEEYLVPLYGSETGKHVGHLPPAGGHVELLGEHTLQFSACKRSEAGNALIVRVWNVAREPTAARVLVGGCAGRPSRVQRVDLKEELIADGPIPLDEDGSFVLHAGPAQIVTVAIWF